MKIIFFGTPLFSAHVLEFLLQNGVEVAAVISKPDRPKGRSGQPVPTPVKSVVLSQNSPIPLFQPDLVSAPEFADVLKSFDADLFVVVAYGEIIKQHLLEMPKKACINLHTSLLPRYRGAAPIQRAIMEGETETGVTLIHMVKKMDAGDMIEQVRVPIGAETTFGELEESLCEAGKKALLQMIRTFETSEPSRIVQDTNLVNFAPKIELEECEISWNNSAQAIHNLVRGVNPYPGAWCYVTVKGEKKRLKISKTRVVKTGDVSQEISSEHKQLSENPGTLLNLHYTKGNLIITTGSGALELLEVQLEGKKSMASEELTRGIPRASLCFIL